MFADYCKRIPIIEFVIKKSAFQPALTSWL